MPYIKPEDRKKFSSLEVIGATAESCGELNYVISMIVKGYLNKRALLRYQDINDAMGALENAKLELYRRIAVPYEDSKIRINGDI